MFSKSQVGLAFGALLLGALTDWRTLSVCVLLCCVLKVGLPLLKRTSNDKKSNNNSSSSSSSSSSKNSNSNNSSKALSPTNDHYRRSSSTFSSLTIGGKRLPFSQTSKSPCRFTRFRKFTNEQKLVWIEGMFLVWCTDTRRMSNGDIDTSALPSPIKSSSGSSSNSGGGNGSKSCSSPSSLTTRQNVKQLAISEIVVILNGKKTTNFFGRWNGAQKADSDLCFSIISRTKCLDLKACTPKERDVWVKGLYALVAAQYRTPVSEALNIPPKPKWYKQWPASQVDMNAALSAHLRRSPRRSSEAERRDSSSSNGCGERRGSASASRRGSASGSERESSREGRKNSFSQENDSRAKKQRVSDAHFLSIWEPPPISMANTGIWHMTEEDKARVDLTREMLIQRKSLLQHDWEDYLLLAFLREVTSKSPHLTDPRDIAKKNADILMKYENFLLSEVKSLSLIAGPHRSSPASSCPSSSSSSCASPSHSSSSSCASPSSCLSSPLSCSSSSSSSFSINTPSSCSSSSSLSSSRLAPLALSMSPSSSNTPSPFSPPSLLPLSPSASISSLPLGKQTYLGILNHAEGRELIEGPIKRAAVNVFHGFDRQGRPIVFERTGRTDVEKLLQLPEQQVLDAHILFLLSFRERLGRASQELKKAVPQFVYVLDMQDAGLTMRPLIKLLKLCSTWDIEFMPNTVGVIYVINVPQTILWMYNLCSFFMDKDTAKKIQFFGAQSQWGPALRQCISDNQLPNEYGGSCTWCNGKGRECIPPYPS